MDISVILTTARFGGFDILFSSMLAQEFDGDFQVVVCDEYYEERKDRIARYIKPSVAAYWNDDPGLDSKFDFVHIPSKRIYRIYDDSLGVNTALAAASGELAVILADYTWAPADYLQAHWDFYKANPGWSMSCYLDRYPLSPMKGEPYSIERDWWSVFAKDFAPNWFDNQEPTYRERRGSVGKVHDDGKVEIPGDYIYLLGDSIPMEIVRKLNGIDERYVGGYGSNDVDFGVRANHVGHRWALNPHVRLKKLTLSNQNQIPGKAKPKVVNKEDPQVTFADVALGFATRIQSRLPVLTTSNHVKA
jgi:hypothetical protein